MVSHQAVSPLAPDLADLYKTNADLKDLAQQHPNNHLLSGRGPPGTHDVSLAKSVLSAVQSINDDTAKTVDLPIFDKSLCGGEGDRSEETVKIEGPIDVFILEGWSLGFAPLSIKELKSRHDEAAQSSNKPYFASHSLDSLLTLNDYLTDFGTAIYPPFSTFIQIEPETYEHVFKWRLEQERAMKATNGGRGMADYQVHAFVERYMPGYELWKEGIWVRGTPWAGRGLSLFFGEGREVIRIATPAAPPSDIGKPSMVDAVPSASNAATTTPSSSTIRNSLTSSSSQPTPSVPLTPQKANFAAKPAQSTPTTPSKRFNPTWSRKFLAAKSPLNPTYDQVSSLATLHQDSPVLKSSPDLAFFPVQGPGGRLGVHPLKKKGRMVVGGEGCLSGGTELADFAVEMFEGEGGRRVALAGDDGVIRVWRVGADGIQGTGPEPQMVLKGE